MNIYFLAGLLCAGGLGVILLIWLCRALQTNWARQNRIGISYLLPIMLSILLVLVTIFEFKPRFLDFMGGFRDNLKTYTLEPEQLDIRGHSLYILGQRFVLNPEQQDIPSGHAYRVSVAPHSGLVIKIEEVAEAEGEEPPLQ